MKNNNSSLIAARHRALRTLELIHLAAWLFEVAHWLYRHGPFVF